MCTTIAKQAFHIEELRPLIDNAKTRGCTFQETLQYFRNHALSVAHVDLRHSTQQSGRTRHVHHIDNKADDGRELELMIYLANRHVPEEYHLPKELFMAVPGHA